MIASLFTFFLATSLAQSWQGPDGPDVRELLADVGAQVTVGMGALGSGSPVDVGAMQAVGPFQHGIIALSEVADYLWAVHFKPLGDRNALFVDWIGTLDFQGQIYNINQPMVRLQDGTYSTPPLPLGAADMMTYKFVYWLDGMTGAQESSYYSFSPK
eukprot:g76999.t1